MAVTPMSFEHIEKFQCLKSSTAQGPSPQFPRIHLACVKCPQKCLKFVEFSVPNRFIWRFFEIQVAVSFPIITLSI